MNRFLHRVIFNAARGLWVAVQETASSGGKGRSAGSPRTCAVKAATAGFIDMLHMREIVFAGLCVFGMQPVLLYAQVAASPSASSANKPAVGATANGLPIVQITTPNGAGVSNNVYSSFNVGKQGLILNNSPGTVQTQQAGLVAGNPYLASGSARIIVNQVVGGGTSQLLGYTEVAGQQAQVVIANPAGIYCNGCGFINTSRGVLTTGTPVFGGSGSLDAFHVTGGQIQIDSGGLNASNVDQVDLIARSVQVNGKLWAGRALNVVNGANDVRYDGLSAQALAPNGNAPGVAIDVAQLGGMYAGKITLVGTETGVGVNMAGTLQAQAGDISLSSKGKVTLSGTTTASGNVAVSAAGDVSNSGSLYATQNATVSAQGQVANSGTLAALGNTSVSGASVNETGSLGAGIDVNGNVTGSGSLTVTGTGAVSATGQQMAGGDLALSGSSLNMAGAQTLAKGGVSLTATGAGGDTGNIVHTGAALQAGGSLRANAAGTVTNDHGQVSAAQLSVSAATLSNRSGTLSQTGTLATTLSASGAFDNTGGTVTTSGQTAAIRSASLANANGTISHAGTGALSVRTGALDDSHGSIATNGVATLVAASIVNRSGSITSAQALNLASSGDIDNTAGRVEAAGAVSVSGANVQNASGRIVSQNADGLTLTASGQITNAAGTTAQGATGGVIGSNGNTTIQASSLTNSGTVTAAQNVGVTASGALDDSGGTMSGATLTANAASLKNASGAISANAVSLSIPQLDNSGGTITANQLNVIATNLTNQNGSVTQLGSGAMGVNVSGALDNSNGGVIQTKSADLTLAPSMLNNDGGTITHAGTGTLTITSGSGAGTLANVGGKIVTNGQATLSAGSVDDTGGTITAQTGLNATIGGTLNNTNGRIESNASLSVTSGAAITNTNGTIAALNNTTLQAASLTNSGTLAAGGLLTTQSNTLTNTGTIVGGSMSLNATQTLSNLGPRALIGATDSAGTLELLAPDIENRDDTTATDTQATTAIYGLGKVVLAGGKDASGNYTNANLIRNQSALIQSGGDMEIHANQVTNTRRVMTTTGFTSSVDPNLLQSLGISLSGCTAIDMAACSGQFVGMASASDPRFANLIGGVFTLPVGGGGQWNSGYEYTTYTGVAAANTIASVSPESQILAGGNLNASSAGTFQNYWSQVAAAGNIASPQRLDQNSWAGQTAPQVQVTYSGQYHYDNYDNSIHNWQLPFGNAGFVTPNPGGYTQPAPADIRTYALPSYESTFTAGGTISGTGVTINNTAGNAAVPLPGQTAVAVVQGGPAVGNSGLANFNNPVIAAATAVHLLNNLTVPPGGLFHADTAPNAPYLIETNPAFTNQKQWLSSDYYFQQMGMNPGLIQMRLGDGFYEQKLVQNQILSLTGKSVLTNYASTQDEFQALMTSGAQLAKSLALAPGAGLSAEQVAHLTSNVVIMQTQVVDGQSVLVPVVYLANASQENMANGPVVAATNIDLQNAQAVTNSGTIKAADGFALSARSIDSAFGTLQSGGQMSLVSAGNVNLTSATVNAGSLALQAGGNLTLNTAVNTLHQVNGAGVTRDTATLGPLASINVTGDAAIVTGGNFEQDAAALNVGGALGMSIGGNWTLGVAQTGETKVMVLPSALSDTHLVSNTGSSVKVGGTSTIAVGGDLTASGATLGLGGGGTIAAGGNVTLQAARATTTVDSYSSGSDNRGAYATSLHTSDDTVTGTTLTSGDSLTLASGKDLNVIGSGIELTKGNATLAAGGDVNIGAATETHVSNSYSSGSHGGFLSSTSQASTRDTTTTQADGSTISADAVTITSGRDVNVKGSTVVGMNDVSLSAAHDVNIMTTKDTMQSSSSYEEHHSGLMAGGGLSVSIGSSKLATTDQSSSVTNNASTVGSLNGNLSIQAGNTLHVTGSDLVAGQDVTGTAANVIVDAATDTAHQAHTERTSKSGLTIGLSGSIGDAINNAISETQAARNSSSGNDRAAALHAMAAAGDVAFAGMGAYKLLNGATGAQAPSIGIQLSVGSSHSSSQSSEDQAMQRGSSVQSGGTATFVATGNGAPGDGNITISGSDVNAKDVLLAAKNQVNLVNTTNTDVTQSSNSSSGASFGVSIGTNGIGVSASMQRAHGDGNSNAAMQNNTHVKGADTVAIVSGGDTNIIGSDVKGGAVTANVGGNLNVASVQDTTVSTAHQSSMSAGFSISETGGSASFSAQNGHADANYAGVNEQAGIEAGSGGFNVNVKGNTDLKGAYIASMADAPKNSLTTGTLTYSDIQDHSHYSAASNGISAGAGVGMTGKAVGPGSVSGSGGVVPMISQDANGDQSATTRSAVSAGTINVTNGAGQTQDVSGLSRDTTNTNGTVSQTPNVQNILSQQADTMQAAQAAGQVVAQGIGAYADSKQKDAQDKATAAKIAGDTAAAAQYQAEADSWAEGGSNRVELHIVGGALIGGLGGGSFGTAFAGAAGAGVSSAFAGKLNSMADSIGNATGSMTLGNVVSNVLATTGGALVGGSAGAFTASNADLYNRSKGNGSGTGGTGSDFLDRLGDAIKSTANDPLGALNHALNSIIPAPGQKPDADANPLVQANDGGHPPAAGGSVVMVPQCDGPVCIMTPVATLGASANTPPNATMARGGDQQSTGMLGENGTQTASKRIWKGDGSERIDVENPNPGQRPGQIHYQDNKGNKYLYDPTTNSFPDAPNSVNKLLNDPSFNAAIQKGLNKYLGGK
ncbi:tRNA nuclease CdiA-2 [Burkholderia multivorans]